MGRIFSLFLTLLLTLPLPCLADKEQGPRAPEVTALQYGGVSLSDDLLAISPPIAKPSQSTGGLRRISSYLLERSIIAYNKLDSWDEPTLRFLEKTDPVTLFKVLQGGWRPIDLFLSGISQLVFSKQPEQLPGNLKVFRLFVFPASAFRGITEPLEERFFLLRPLNEALGLIVKYLSVETPAMADQRRLLWSLRSVYVEDALQMLGRIEASAGGALKSCARVLSSVPGSVVGFVGMHPELAPMVNELIDQGREAVREELTKIDPTGGAIANRAVFYGEGITWAVAARQAIAAAEANAYTAGLYTRYFALEPLKGWASSARALGSRSLQLGSALGRLTYYSGVNLLKSIPFKATVPGSPITGGAVLALPAIVYGHFQGEYSAIRSEHAESTDDCQDLADPLYRRHRDRCEREFSSDESVRLECLKQARDLFKREINACIDELQSAKSIFFFD